MAINFPISPSLNQIYSYNGLSWQWNGSYWQSFPPSSGATGVVRTLTASTGLSANTTTGDITILFTGSTGSVFTGGTVSGATSFTGGLSANTISATTYQNLPLSVSGGGTTNYIPKWTGTTGLGNSQIQDNGNYLAIGITPSSGVKFWIYTTSASTYGIRGDGTSGGVYGQGVGSGYGVYGNANSSIGVVGSSVGDSGTNIGVYGSADINEGGLPTNIGGHFLAQNGGSNYSVHLQDGTEGVNKVLISTTSDGKANWSNVLTGLTNVQSTTIKITSTKGSVITDGNTSTAFITVSGSNTIGGVNYVDFLRVTNTAAGATNINKTLRVNNTGSLEVINNAYTTTIFSLTDAGVLSTPGGGTSDLKTKKNVEYIEDKASDLISKLKPVKFEFKNNEGVKRHGFIAQDVLEVEPDLVLGDGHNDNGTYGLDYYGILAMTVKSLQECLDKIEQLENRIKDLENR